MKQPIGKACFALALIVLGVSFGATEANSKSRNLKFATSDGTPVVYPDDLSCPRIESDFADQRDIDGDRRIPHKRFPGSDKYYEKWHRGLDIPAPKGTEVLSTHDGTVYSTTEHPIGGKVVVISKSVGLTVFYSHYFHLIQFADIKKCDRIRSGDVIGYIGNTGTSLPLSKTPHLHYELIDSYGITIKENGMFEYHGAVLLNPHNFWFNPNPNQEGPITIPVYNPNVDYNAQTEFSITYPVRCEISVRRIQEILTGMGYDPGPIDGAWGGKTRTALNELRAVHNLPPVEQLEQSTYDLFRTLADGGN